MYFTLAIFIFMEIVWCLFGDVYKASHLTVPNDCIKTPQMKTELITECVLECQRKHLLAILKDGICYCTTTDCKKFTSGDSTTAQIFTRRPVTNLALKRNTSQSSTYNAGGYSYPSRLAVDGNNGTTGNYGRCTSTQSSNTLAWWKVTLDKESIIQEIRITNRMDCCSERLSNAKIYVLHGVKKQLCAIVGNMKSVAVQSFRCSGGSSIVGDTVIIENERLLIICEVEVFGV